MFDSISVWLIKEPPTTGSTGALEIAAELRKWAANRSKVNDRRKHEGKRKLMSSPLLEAATALEEKGISPWPLYYYRTLEEAFGEATRRIEEIQVRTGVALPRVRWYTPSEKQRERGVVLVHKSSWGIYSIVKLKSSGVL
jgi:hypothetical protein